MKFWKGVEICQEFKRQLGLLTYGPVYSTSR